MKLTYIGDPGCYRVSDAISGIFAVAQLEQEYHPYLTLDYLPNRDNKQSRVIINANEDEIIIPVKFDTNPQDIEKVRDAIWSLMKKHYKIKNYDDITHIPIRSNIVTSGYKNAAKQKSYNSYKTHIKAKGKPESASLNKNKMLHEVFKLDNRYNIDKSNCVSVLGQQCDDNYPKGTHTHYKCMNDIKDVCNCALSKGSVDQGYIHKNREGNVISRTEFNNLIFDNLYRTNVRCPRMDHKYKDGNSIEGFCQTSNKSSSINISKYILLVVILIILMCFYKNNKM